MWRKWNVILSRGDTACKGSLHHKVEHVSSLRSMTILQTKAIITIERVSDLPNMIGTDHNELMCNIGVASIRPY